MLPFVLLDSIFRDEVSSASWACVVLRSDGSKRALSPWWWLNSAVVPQASEASSKAASRRARFAGLWKIICAGLRITVLEFNARLIT